MKLNLKISCSNTSPKSHRTDIRASVRFSLHTRNAELLANANALKNLSYFNSPVVSFISNSNQINLN